LNLRIEDVESFTNVCGEQRTRWLRVEEEGADPLLFGVLLDISEARLGTGATWGWGIRVLAVIVIVVLRLRSRIIVWGLVDLLWCIAKSSEDGDRVPAGADLDGALEFGEGIFFVGLNCGVGCGLRDAGCAGRPGLETVGVGEDQAAGAGAEDEAGGEDDVGEGKGCVLGLGGADVDVVETAFEAKRGDQRSLLVELLGGVAANAGLARAAGIVRGEVAQEIAVEEMFAADFEQTCGVDEEEGLAGGEEVCRLLRLEEDGGGRNGFVGHGALFAEHDALNMMGAAGGSVAGDERGAHLGVALGGLEFAGHSGEEAGEDKLLFDADDGVVGTGHADVCLVGGAAGEDALVGGGDVGMGAEQGGDAAVEIPAEGYFFAGGFAVQVEQDDLGGDLAEEFVGLAKGVVATGHEDAALEVHDGVLLAVA
jgi:hypothetical protein